MQPILFEKDVSKEISSGSKSAGQRRLTNEQKITSHTNAPDLIISTEQNEEIWEVPTYAPTRYLSHDYFRYIGKFPPQIPRQLLLDYSSSGDKVFDPMCGGGTTLIEGRILNRRGYASDVNPVSVLISSVATRSLAHDELTKEVLSFITAFQELNSAQGYIPTPNLARRERQNFKLPDMHGHEKYFDEETLKGLQSFFSLSETVSSKEVRDFLLVALLSVLRSVSHANVKKMNLELDLEKKTRKTLNEALSKKLQRMLTINSDLLANFTGPEPEIQEKSAEDSGLPDEDIDLVLVHPPYLSNTAFSEATQLQLAVLGISHLTIWRRELRARGSFLHEPNGVQKYIVGWNRTLKEIFRILRRGGNCAVVVGDGQVDYTRIPIGVITIELAQDIGFKLVRKARHRLNHNTGKTLSRKMRDQHILVFQK